MEDKLRKLIALSEPVLKWAKLTFEVESKENALYTFTIQALIELEEIKAELLKRDPRSSRKFKQKKLF